LIEPVFNPDYVAMINRLNKHDDPYEPLLKGVDKHGLIRWVSDILMS